MQRLWSHLPYYRVRETCVAKSNSRSKFLVEVEFQWSIVWTESSETVHGSKIELMIHIAHFSYFVGLLGTYPIVIRSSESIVG